jgi:2-C-methyl-D-erythritol 4-phosphate cytidylyltransferase
MSNEVTTAVVLAAGEGKRLGAGLNKIYIQLAGRPLLSHCLHAFDRSPLIDQIVLVVAHGEEGRAGGLVGSLTKDNQLVRGGKRRRDSALAGVEAAKGRIVLIHDAARPFPSLALIKRVVEGTKAYGACVPVIPMADTMRYSNGEGFLFPQTVVREGLLRMQTPQGFERELIRRCLKLNEEAYADDAAAVLTGEARVWSVSGEATNLKVTTKTDLVLAEAVAAQLARTEC